MHSADYRSRGSTRHQITSRYNSCNRRSGKFKVAFTLHGIVFKVERHIISRSVVVGEENQFSAGSLKAKNLLWKSLIEILIYISSQKMDLLRNGMNFLESHSLKTLHT